MVKCGINKWEKGILWIKIKKVGLVELRFFLFLKSEIIYKFWNRKIERGMYWIIIICYV